MATVLKSIVGTGNVNAGAQATVAHGLNLDGRGLVPDVVDLGASSFSFVSANSTEIVVQNDGDGAAAANILCESWYSTDRVFGADSVDALDPRPFVRGGGGDGGGGDAIVGAAVISTNGGADPAALVLNSRDLVAVDGVAEVSPGVVDVTLSANRPANGYVQGQLLGNAGESLRLAYPAANVVRVTTWNAAGAEARADFHVILFNVA